MTNKNNGKVWVKFKERKSKKQPSMISKEMKSIKSNMRKDQEESL